MNRDLIIFPLAR